MVWLKKNLGDKIAKKKKKAHYARIDCITIVFVMRMKKKVLSATLFRKMQIQNYEGKDV